MAIRTVDEIMESVRTHVGDSTDDTALSLIEDINDTMNDLVTKANGDKENWKEKYEENDKMWRTKYRDRFFNSKDDEEFEEKETEEKEKITKYDELFKEE